MPNEAISKLVLTEEEKYWAAYNRCPDHHICKHTPCSLFSKALALSKALEDGTLLYTGDRLSSRIVIDVPIEGDS